MGFLRQVAALLFIIAIPVALITTNIRLAVNEPRVYSYAADRYDTPERTGIARSELLRASSELRQYFNRAGDEPVFIRVQKDGAPVSLFNARETEHLRDVKGLFQMTFRVQEASVVFVLAYVVGVFIWAREGSLRALATQVLLAGALGLAVIGVVGAVAVAGFEQSFERFHLIAFDNDLWRLDPERDHLIQMFPEAFWRDVSLWTGLATLVELSVLALAAGVYMSVSKQSPFAFPVRPEVERSAAG